MGTPSKRDRSESTPQDNPYEFLESDFLTADSSLTICQDEYLAESQESLTTTLTPYIRELVE